MAQITKKYVSTIDYLDKRDILKQIIDETNEEASLIDIFEASGRMVTTDVPTYHHFINTELYDNVTLDAATGAANVQQALTLNAGHVSRVKKGDLLMGNTTTPAGGKVVVRVQSIDSATQITVKNVDGTTAFVMADNTVLAPFSNAFGEGSPGPDPTSYSKTKRQNQVQILKGSIEMTDVQLASKVEASYGGSDYYFVTAQHEGLLKYRSDLTFNAFFSKASAANFEASSPSLVDEASRPVQTTSGYNEQIETYGITEALSGVMGIAEMKAFHKEARLRRSPRSYMIICGSERDIDVTDVFKNFAGSDIQSARLNLDGKDLDFDVETVTLYGTKYNKVYNQMLDHPKVVNFTGSTGYQNAAYFLPDGKVPTMGAGSVDRVRMRYLSGEGMSNGYRETNTGGLAPVPTNDTSVWKITWETNMGAEMLGSNVAGRIL